MPTPTLVRQVLPGQLWDHYSEVRAYETVMPRADVPTLHALRIDSKSLRYALEFFREVLEPILGADKANGIGFSIEAVVALQDHIGNLHDADVTIARLHTFLQDHEIGDFAPVARNRLAVRQYMKTRQAELPLYPHSAGRPWSVVSRVKFRKRLGKVTAGLGSAWCVFPVASPSIHTAAPNRHPASGGRAPCPSLSRPSELHVIKPRIGGRHSAINSSCLPSATSFPPLQHSNSAGPVHRLQPVSAPHRRAALEKPPQRLLHQAADSIKLEVISSSNRMRVF
jgi:hypothetical protein